ncbi:ATPase involved in chromosome partitioning, partial [Giardia duodenalis]
VEQVSEHLLTEEVYNLGECKATLLHLGIPGLFNSQNKMTSILTMGERHMGSIKDLTPYGAAKLAWDLNRWNQTRGVCC